MNYDDQTGYLRMIGQLNPTPEVRKERTMKTKQTDKLQRDARILRVENIFADDLHRLRAVTDGCCEDMHEPDEQSISATFGPRDAAFDNADTNAPDKGVPSDKGFWIIKTNGQGKVLKREWFNLADIVALARR